MIQYLFNHIEKIDEELLDQQTEECSGLVLKKYLCKVEGRVTSDYFKNIKTPDFVNISYKKTALEGFLLMVLFYWNKNTHFI